MRRGLERYAPSSGYDVGMYARQKYAQLVVQKAGVFPGDWILDVETGLGILGVQVSRAFTRCKVVATDTDVSHLARARENAKVEGCVERMRFVRASPDALPFKDESFYFATIGLDLARAQEPLDVLDEIHRATGYAAKVYAPTLDLTRVKPKPRGWRAVVFDAETTAAMREMGFGKITRQRVAVLADGAQLDLLMAKRFDATEGDEEDEAGDEETDEG